MEKPASPRGRQSRAPAVLLFYFAVAAAMTYPLAFHLASTDWLGAARRRPDVFNHFWNAWLLESGAFWRTDGFLGRTELLHFPRGFELAFHTFDLFQMTVASAWARLAGPVAGYNLATFVTLPLAAFSAYLLVLELVADRRAAWFGGLVFAFLPWTLFHVAIHPDLLPPFPLPLALLCLVRAARSATWSWSLAGGAALGSTAFFGLYGLVLGCATALSCALALSFTEGRRRSWNWWRGQALFWLAAAALAALRVGPMMAFRGELASVLAQKFDSESGADLLRLLLPFGNPLLFATTAARGLEGPDVSLLVPLVPLGLAIYGALGGPRRGAARVCLALAAFFGVLTLGATLRVAGHEIASMPLSPERLARWLPLPFAAFRDAKLYFLGVPLALAVGAGCGMGRWLSACRSEGSRRAALVLAALLTLLPSWLGPFRSVEVAVSPFYRELAASPDRFALVELPFGRPFAKRYLYFQTVHGRPIQEGAVSRDVPSRRPEWSANCWFAAWSGSSSSAAPTCGGDAEQARRDATALSESGFRFVIAHEPERTALAAAFASVAPAYQDAELTAWRVAELASPPAAPALGPND